VFGDLLSAGIVVFVLQANRERFVSLRRFEMLVAVEFAAAVKRARAEGLFLVEALVLPALRRPLLQPFQSGRNIFRRTSRDRAIWRLTGIRGFTPAGQYR
jgi:hypothetical protein